MPSFRDEMVSEATEAIVHEAVANEIRAAATPGASDKDIAARVIAAIANPRGPVMALAQTLPGFSFPMAGTAIAYLFGKTKFLDRVLPEMNTPAVRATKELLRHAGPGIIIGVLSGVRDAAQDINRGDIRVELDTVRSDATVPTAYRTRPLDWLVMTRLIPGRMFVPRHDVDGVPTEGEPPVPIVLDQTWVALKAMWDDTHKATTRQVGGGKNQPQRTEKIPAEPFPHTWVRIEDLASMDGVTITPEDMATIRGLLVKPTSWWETVGPEVRQFLIILCRSLRSNSALEYGLREDHVKDVVEAASPVFLKDLAAEYLPKARGGYFPTDVVCEIIDTFDAALGSELTAVNKVKSAIARVWANRARLPGMAKAALGTVAFLGLLSIFAQIALFLTAFAGVIYGALMSYEGLARLPFTSRMFEANWLAAGLMGAGGVTIIVLLYTLKVWQRVWSPVVAWFGESADFLENYRWHFTYMMLPVFLFAIGAVFFETSIYARVLVLAIACARVAVGHGFRIAQDDESSRLITWRSSRYGIPIILGVFVLDWMIRMQWGGIEWTRIVKHATDAWSYLGSKRVLAIAARAGLGVAAAILAINFLEKRYDGRSGNTVFYSRKTSLLARTLAIPVVLLIALFPWFDMPNKQWVPFSKPATADVDVTLQDADGSTVRVKGKANASGLQIKSVKGKIKLGVPSRGAGRAADNFDCSGLNPEQRKFAGCP